MAHSLSPTLLILAISGRALAQSARRAGFAPLVADFFADRDTREAAAGWARIDGDLADGFQPEAVIAALSRLEQQAPSPPVGLVYGAGLESRPELIAQIVARWPVIGNNAATVARVKDPRMFFGALNALGTPCPEVRLRKESLLAPSPQPSPQGGEGVPFPERQDLGSSIMAAAQLASPLPGGERDRVRGSSFREECWLLKRTGGAGGSHIKMLDGDAELPDRAYAQLLVKGRAVSALILSGNAGTRVLGLSEQWTSPAPGKPFRYGGAVQPAEISAADERAMHDIARRIGEAFGLRGLGSVDFILTQQGPLVLEVNPRPGATLDIFDSNARPLLALHVAACVSNFGDLCVPLPLVGRGQGWGSQRLFFEPPTPALPHKGGGSPDSTAATTELANDRARASHIVFAPHDLSIPHGTIWPNWTADLPHDGETICESRPVCTVHAEAASPAAARALAAHRESMILESIQKPPASCRKV